MIKIRQCGLPGFELNDYIQESLDFLRAHEPRTGYYVGFSGGKDSIVSLKLCEMAHVKHQAYFTCTTIDPPEIYKFIRKNYPQIPFLYPKQSFWKSLIELYPPSRNSRWCCDKLKKDHIKDLKMENIVLGIRGEESNKRAKYTRIHKYTKYRTLYYPIFYWPEWAVWNFIELYKLPYPNLYDEGCNRIGCVICPLIFGKSRQNMQKITYSQHRWPQLWKVFKSVVKKWFFNYSKTTKYNAENMSFEDFWHYYLTGFEDFGSKNTEHPLLKEQNNG